MTAPSQLGAQAVGAPGPEDGSTTPGGCRLAGTTGMTAPTGTADGPILPPGTGGDPIGRAAPSPVDPTSPTADITSRAGPGLVVGTGAREGNQATRSRGRAAVAVGSSSRPAWQAFH